MAYLKPSGASATSHSYITNPGLAFDGPPGDTSTSAIVSWTGTTSIGGVGYATFSGFPGQKVASASVSVNWSESAPGELAGSAALAIMVGGSVVASAVYGEGGGTLTATLSNGTDPSTVSVRAYAHRYKYQNPDWVPDPFGNPHSLGQYIWEEAEVDVSDIWIEYTIPQPSITSANISSCKTGGSLVLSGAFWDITSVLGVSQYGTYAAAFTVAADRSSITITIPAMTHNSGGLIDFRITNSTGSATFSNFKVLQPLLQSASPTIGNTTTPLSLVGSNLLNNVSGLFVTSQGQNQAASAYTIGSDTSITGITFAPTPPEGIWSLTVVAPNGDTSSVGYIAVSPPQVNLYPATPVLLGGAFSIQGSHFHNNLTVTQNGKGLQYNVVSENRLDFTAWKGMGAAGITITTAGGVVTTNPIPVQSVAVAIEAPPQYVSVGWSDVMSASVTGAVDTRVSWSVSSGNAHFSGNTLVADGTGSISIRATSLADPTVSSTATLSVVAAPSASIITAKSPITAGGSTTLTPTFRGGSGSINHGVGAVSSGSPVSTGNLSATTSFSLTVESPSGDTASASVSVIVVPAPVISGFTSDTPSVYYGDSSVITPVFTGGSGVVTPGNTGVSSGHGLGTGSLTANRHYTLTVTNPAGDAVIQGLDIAVIQPTISPITTSVSTLTYGSGVTLTCGATVSDAVNTGVTWGGDLPISASGVVTLPPQPTSGLETAGSGVASFRSYAITASSTAKPSVATSTSVKIYAVPRIQGVTTSNIPEGNLGSTPYGLAPIIRVGGDGWFNGSAELSGVGALTLNTDYTLPPVTAPATYTVTVTNPVGALVTKSFTFTPLGTKVAPLAYTVGPGNFVESASSVNLSTTVTGATSPEVVWSATGGSLSFVTGSTVTWNAPATPGAYTVTATAKSDGTQSQSALFNVATTPVVTSFTADLPNPVLYGQTVTVTPVFTAMVGKVSDAHIPAGGDWGEPDVSGVGVIYPKLRVGFHSSLSLKNEVGNTVYADLDVTLQTVTLTPLDTPYVEAGATHQFTSTVSGAVDTSTTWACSGGNIDSTGLWTAPTHYGSYTIIATSSANTSVAVSTIAVVPLQRRYVVKKLTATASSN